MDDNELLSPLDTFIWLRLATAEEGFTCEHKLVQIPFPSQNLNNFSSHLIITTIIVVSTFINIILTIIFEPNFYKEYLSSSPATCRINGVELKDLDIQCKSCRTEITVYKKDHVIDDEINESHRGVILPCGLIFGASCIKYFFKMKEEEGVTPFCMKCCTESVHPSPGCRHTFWGKSMPTHKPEMDSIPPVLREGGEIADRCKRCSTTKALQDVLLELEKMPGLPPQVTKFSISIEVDG
ncbi:hypothetical protein FBEOM_13571 [Fusarium beomiforme]|uniref:RING-type domain-containing protein n=1 Tax=Fusarium beomiforme TaxID=44412 RepID=A0A9P5DNE1_9HYPO|nr:hypothetical protein FBEOM_13571 [Fusarium beomiforme]